MQKTKTSNSNNYSLLKQISLGVVTVLSFILFWYLSYRFFYGGGGGSISIWGKTTGFAGLFFGLFLAGTFIGLLGVLLKKWWVALATYFLGLVAYYIFLPFNLVSVLALILLWIVLVLVFLSIKEERKVRIKISIYKILRRGLPIALTVVAMVLAVSYYVSSAKNIKENGLEIPRQSFEDSTGILEKYISEAYIPGFNKNMSVSEASFQLLLNEVTKEGGSWRDLGFAKDLEGTLQAEGINISDDSAVSDALENNTVVRDKALELYQNSETDKNIIGSLGLGSFSENQPIIDAAYTALNDKINDVLNPYRSIVPVAFAITFFLVIQFANFFVKWLVYGAVQLIFIILKATKFIKVVKVLKEVEEIKY